MSKAAPPMFRGTDRLFMAARACVLLPLFRDDVKTSTWVVGFAASSVMCTIIVTLWFDMSWWESIIAILFGIPLAVICIQCTGETDTTPTGAVGKVRVATVHCIAVVPLHPLAVVASCLVTLSWS